MKYVITCTLSSGQKYYVSDEKVCGFVLHVLLLDDALIFRSEEAAKSFIKKEKLKNIAYNIERIEKWNIY